METESKPGSRARIGITRGGPVERIPNSYQAYHRRVVEAGGEPVDLVPSDDSAISGVLDSLNGLLLTGGSDVLPERYGAAPHPETDAGDGERDAMELTLLRGALARDLPVLAICRGQQLLNVGYGGALLQHIEGDAHRALSDAERSSRWHDVIIEPKSRLAAILGSGRIQTNSRHHQAVLPDAVGGGLLVSARADDGVIEALESAEQRWLVAVQWHPERDEVAERFQPLFRAFLAAASSVPASA